MNGTPLEVTKDFHVLAFEDRVVICFQDPIGLDLSPGDIHTHTLYHNDAMALRNLLSRWQDRVTGFNLNLSKKNVR